MTIPQKDIFYAATKEVIQHLEGGYYHPNMMKKEPTRFAVYTNSGETMFGLDRHAGHDLFYSTPRKSSHVFDNIKYIESGVYVYKSLEAEEFWKSIDEANAKNEWKWNSRGGSFEEQLTHLASSIMYFEFIRLANKFLLEESKTIAFNDSRILFHFIYATWNGSGFFNYYSGKFNEKIKQTQNPDRLLLDSIQLRLKSDYSMIVNSGNKMLQLFSKK
jgi:hypothetical protein